MAQEEAVMDRQSKTPGGSLQGRDGPLKSSLEIQTLFCPT